MLQLQEAIKKLITPCREKWAVVYDRFEGHALSEAIVESPWKDARAGTWDVNIASQESIQKFTPNLTIGPVNIPIGSMQRNEGELPFPNCLPTTRKSLCMRLPLST
jgi:hypothetical protein